MHMRNKKLFNNKKLNKNNKYFNNNRKNKILIIQNKILLNL